MIALVALSGAVGAMSAGTIHHHWHDDPATASTSTAVEAPLNGQHGQNHIASLPIPQPSPQSGLTWVLGGLLTGVAAALAALVNKPRQLAGRLASQMTRPVGALAKTAIKGSAAATGFVLGGAMSAIPKRIRWRLISLGALAGGILLLLSNGWGVWIALALLLAGSIGMVVTARRTRQDKATI